MRNKILAAFSICCLVTLICGCEQRQEQEDAKAIDSAIEKAVEKAVKGLSEGAVPGVERAAIGPFRGPESGSVREYLQARGTRGPYEIYVHDDKEWNMLLDEIAWGARKDDIMDQATIQKFGRIQGVEAFLYGAVKDVSIEDFKVRVKLLVNLAVVETGRNAWGDSFEAEVNRNIYEASKPYWKYARYVVAGLVVLVLVVVVLRRLAAPR